MVWVVLLSLKFRSNYRKKASFQTLLGAKVVLEGEKRIPNEMRKSQHLEVVSKSLRKNHEFDSMR